MLKKLILFPFGGNARESVLSIKAINSAGEAWDIVGFMDDDPQARGKECCGIKVRGGRELLKKYPDAFVLAIPGRDSNYRQRKAVIENLGINVKRFATIIHPSVVAAEGARIGYNVLIMPNVFVSCGVDIGNHCVILPNTVISHDAVVGDFTMIGSNVSVSGSVNIGSSCYIGSGARIIQGIAIGEGALVGIGSVVIRPVKKGQVVAGCPAKVLKTVKSAQAGSAKGSKK